MTGVNKIFGINSYSYTLNGSAADCIRHLADQGYVGVELMMYPGHLWPDLDASGRRDLRRAAEERGVRIISLNMPNVDLNMAGASREMHDPVGMGDVPFAVVPPVLAEVGYQEMPVLEIISHDADADLRDSAQRLAALGYG